MIWWWWWGKWICTVTYGTVDIFLFSFSLISVFILSSFLCDMARVYFFPFAFFLKMLFFAFLPFIPCIFQISFSFFFFFLLKYFLFFLSTNKSYLISLKENLSQAFSRRTWDFSSRKQKEKNRRSQLLHRKIWKEPETGAKRRHTSFRALCLRVGGKEKCNFLTLYQSPSIAEVG